MLFQHLPIRHMLLECFASYIAFLKEPPALPLLKILLLLMKIFMANLALECQFCILDLIKLQSTFLLLWSSFHRKKSALLCDLPFRSHADNIKRSIFHSNQIFVKTQFSTGCVKQRFLIYKVKTSQTVSVFMTFFLLLPFTAVVDLSGFFFLIFVNYIITKSFQIFMNKPRFEFNIIVIAVVSIAIFCYCSLPLLWKNLSGIFKMKRQIRQFVKFW